MLPIGSLALRARPSEEDADLVRIKYPQLHKAIPRLRANDPSLTGLELGYEKIDAPDAQALAEALKLNSSLTKLYLGYNQLRNPGAQALAEALKLNRCLTELYLIGNELGDPGAQALAEALKRNSSLTKLDLGDNQLGAPGAQALAEALKQNSGLTELSLGNNQLGYPGAQALAEALKRNSSLTKLDLGDNQLGAPGAQALAEALKLNSSLTELGLGCNELGTPGAQALAEALKQNSCLTQLQLGANRLGAPGAQALAEVLKLNSGLTALDLSFNDLGAPGAQALAEALKLNSGLTYLNLHCNQLGDPGAYALAEALKLNSSLTTLDLSHNQLSDWSQAAVKAAVNAALARNRQTATERAAALYQQALQGRQAAQAAMLPPPPAPLTPPLDPPSATPEPDLGQQLVEEQQLKTSLLHATHQRQAQLATQLAQQTQALADKDQALANLQQQLAPAGAGDSASGNKLRQQIATLEQDKLDLLVTQGELQAHLTTLSLRVELLAEQQASANTAELSKLRDKLQQGEAELARCQAECQNLTLRARDQPTQAVLAGAKQAAAQLKLVEAALIAQRTQLVSQHNLGLSPEVRAWQDFLRELKRLRPWQDSPAPRCFISYAWETPSGGPANRALQAFLLRLQQDLEKLGIPVQLDITDLTGQVKAYMATLRQCRHVLLIGTPRLQARAAEPIDARQGRNNLQIELDHLRSQRQQQPDCLIPLLYQGEAGQAIPADLCGGEVDFRLQSAYAQQMGNPQGGLIARLLGHAPDADYQRAWQHFQAKLTPVSSTALDPVAARTAFQGFLLASEKLCRWHGKTPPICYLSSAPEAEPALAARIEMLVRDLEALGITVKQAGPLEAADYLLLIGTPAYKQQVELPHSAIAQTLAQAQAREVELMPLLFDGKGEEVLPSAVRETLYRDCRTPTAYYRSMANALNPCGMLPELFDIHRRNKPLYKAYTDLLQGLTVALPQP